jgi:hypothetical protein
MLSLALLATLAPIPACSYRYDVVHETACTGGQDEDGDGLVDCDDPDCLDAPACQGPVCNDDDICDPGEVCPGCADCCVGACAPGEGTPYDYIMTHVELPRSAAEGLQIGVDLNGDGVIDNKLGAIFGLFPADVAARLAESFQRKIDAGELILLGRLWVDRWGLDDTAASQALPGLADATVDATEDNFTGDGHVMIAPDADRTDFLCGELTDAGYTAGPGPFVLPIPLMGGITFLDVLQARAVCNVPLTPEQITDMNVGGGMTRTTVENQILPAIQVMTNNEILGNPEGTTAQQLLGWVDANCNSSISGCESVTPGEGDCAPWDHQPTTLPISFAEVRCNFFLNSALAPDIDSDGDQVNDLLSIGMRYDAVHVNIDN